MSIPFVYKNHTLCVGEVTATAIARDFGTPCYVYDTQNMVRTLQHLQNLLSDLDVQICFAVKSNPNTHIIRALKSAGAGADITSYGEMTRALVAGVDAADIIFSGVGKTAEEMKAALNAGIGQFNVESLVELDELSDIAASSGFVAPVALRLNPDVEAYTHPKIATGHSATKFGMSRADIRTALANITARKSLSFKGFAVHVGSCLDDHSTFREAWGELASMVNEARASGIKVERVDLGGGLGIAYDGGTAPSVETYAALIREIAAPLGCRVAIEPGRFLVGNSGLLLTRVTRIKRNREGTFLILDTGMNDLLRPALYEARHTIIPVTEPASGDLMLPYSVVGPICETGDIFGNNYLLPASLQQGDLIAILQAGAYGSAMASMYNGRPLVAEVAVNGGSASLIRRRIDIQEQISWER